MDDTGIEPVTPAMSFSTYAVLWVLRRILCQLVKHDWRLEKSSVLSMHLKGARQLLGTYKSPRIVTILRT